MAFDCGAASEVSVSVISLKAEPSWLIVHDSLLIKRQSIATPSYGTPMANRGTNNVRVQGVAAASRNHVLGKHLA